MHISITGVRSALPMYMQLAGAIEESIAAENMKPGDRLPSEPTLAAQLGLSRATVIKAFEQLVDKGAVVRQQGRGSFVADGTMQRRLPELTSFTEHVQSLGLRAGNQLLGYVVEPAGAKGRADTAFRDEVDLVRIDRIRTVESRPVGLHRTRVDGNVATAIGLTEEVAADTEFSLYRRLRSHGVLVSHARETLRAINADASDAKLLQVAPGTALMEAIRESRDHEDHLVEVVRARYLGSLYLYEIDLTHPEKGDNHGQKVHSARAVGGSVRIAVDNSQL